MKKASHCKKVGRPATSPAVTVIHQHGAYRPRYQIVRPPKRPKTQQQISQRRVLTLLRGDVEDLRRRWAARDPGVTRVQFAREQQARLAEQGVMVHVRTIQDVVMRRSFNWVP